MFDVKINKYLSLFIGVVFLLLLISCEEKTEWDIKNRDMETIVVEGILTNELHHQYVRLTRPFAESNEKPDPVVGAVVILSADQDSAMLVETPEYPGYYFTEDPVAATINRSYRLRILDGENVYSAETGMDPVLPANNPSFIRNPQTQLYRIVWNSAEYNPFEDAMYEALVSWEHLPGLGYPDSLKTVRMMHYTLKTIDVSYNIFPQTKQTVWFPQGSYAIVKKYSVTDEYGDYLRALLAETEWQGSLFEEARGNLPGNISNGGLGFFTACSVIADTLVVQ